MSPWVVGYPVSDPMKGRLVYDLHVAVPGSTRAQSLSSKFKDDTRLVHCPSIKVINGWTQTDHMFDGCTSLESVEPFTDIVVLRNASYMFNGCAALKDAPVLRLDRVTDLSHMFEGCYSLRSVHIIGDGVTVSDCTAMFKGCNKLESVLLENVKIGNASDMFYGCIKLPTDAPARLDTSSCTNFDRTFFHCTGLTELGCLDSSSCTSMVETFKDCRSLRSVSFNDTSKVENFDNVFDYCGKIESIGDYDFSSYKGAACNWHKSAMGSGRGFVNRVTIKNIGRQEECKEINFGLGSWALTKPVICATPDLEGFQSLIDSLLTHSFDRRAAGYEDCVIYKDYNYPRYWYQFLTDEQIAAIEAKGYSLQDTPRS